MKLTQFTTDVLNSYREQWAEIVLSPEVALDALERTGAEPVPVSELSDDELLQLVIRKQSEMLIQRAVDIQGLVTKIVNLEKANAKLMVANSAKMTKSGRLVTGANRAQRRRS